ncbi:stAR-related lipid transfer protein 7, mitochondrial-like [Tachypleus tridentatus]|uniref:stAR-related lipid transfer protein 7, mitochondrial-like n=1 Tax=Tachypleus tridentatus TaxID=6853 RepID=UPI003FD0B0F8
MLSSTILLRNLIQPTCRKLYSGSDSRVIYTPDKGKATVVGRFLTSNISSIKSKGLTIIYRWLSLKRNHECLPIFNTSRQSQSAYNQCFVYGIWLCKQIRSKGNEKLLMLGESLTKQCNFYFSQRFRRGFQICNLYKRLYNEKSIRTLASTFVRRLKNALKLEHRNKFGLLLSAAAFSWEKEKITDEEVLSEIHTMCQGCAKGAVSENGTTGFPENETNNKEWELLVARSNLSAYRKSVPGSSLYEYKVLGSFHDISARAFFNVQLDVEYRKTWDKLVIKLDVIDQNKEDGSEVVHWVMHYPYPLYCRDYVYIRRAVVDLLSNVMVLVSRAVDHPDCPESRKCVRVKSYSSKLIIRPYASFDENGFDYVLTYFDDPKAIFPSPAYNWIASTGVPDFVKKLHDAAKRLQQQSLSQEKCPSFSGSYTTVNIQHFSYA